MRAIRKVRQGQETIRARRILILMGSERVRSKLRRGFFSGGGADSTNGENKAKKRLKTNDVLPFFCLFFFFSFFKKIEGLSWKEKEQGFYFF